MSDLEASKVGRDTGEVWTRSLNDLQPAAVRCWERINAVLPVSVPTQAGDASVNLDTLMVILHSTITRAAEAEVGWERTYDMYEFAEAARGTAEARGEGMKNALEAIAGMDLRSHPSVARDIAKNALEKATGDSGALPDSPAACPPQQRGE